MQDGAIVRILSIDPGSKITGFGLLEAPRLFANIRQTKLLAYGVLRSQLNLSHAERIGQLHEALYTLGEKYKPNLCVIERAFTGINPHSALRLGETRGAVIAAFRRLNIDIAEVSPTQVKKAITGQGHASKEAVQFALKQLLGIELSEFPLDASDAVAIGLSYSLSLGIAASPPSLKRSNPKRSTWTQARSRS